MKKIITPLLACLLIAGCSSAPKTKTETASCSYTQEGLMTATYDLTAENNDITVLSLKMIYDKSMFGDIDFTTITEEEKTQMIDAILTQSGITEDMKGVTTKVEIEDTIIATIEMNLKEADPDTLKNLGFDFSNTDMSFDKVVQDRKFLPWEKLFSSFFFFNVNKKSRTVD